MQLIELVAGGLKNREVAVAMGTSEHVVKNRLLNVFDKTGMWNRVELAIWYERHKAEGSLPIPKRLATVSRRHQ